jgi:DNA-binding PadR family transcriptional regulator
MAPIGLNEALIMTVLETTDAASIADVADRLRTLDHTRFVDDGGIYMALRRMTQRGLVSCEKRTVLSSDGRHRDVGFYTISPAGRDAVRSYLRQANTLVRFASEIGQ